MNLRRLRYPRDVVGDVVDVQDSRHFTNRHDGQNAIEEGGIDLTRMTKCPREQTMTPLGGGRRNL